MTKTLSIGLCAVMLMFSCSRDMEDVNPSTTLNGINDGAAKAPSTANSFEFMHLSTPDGGVTWAFSVKRLGDSKGANANSVLLKLTECGGTQLNLSSTNIQELWLSDTRGHTWGLTPSYLESGRNACPMAASTGYVKFEGIEPNLKDGTVYTFKVKLAQAKQIESAAVQLRAGNDCFSGSLIGPACVDEELDMCGYGQGAFHKTDSWGGHTVTLGSKNYTESEGLALMNPNSGGGNKYVKFAFSQGATVLLNRAMGHISPTAYQAQLDAIDLYLRSMSRLTSANMDMQYDTSDEAIAAKNAAGYIGDNIKCEE
jgi:hypothetical protein